MAKWKYPVFWLKRPIFMDDKSVNSVWKYLGLIMNQMSPLKYANFAFENMPIKKIESLALWRTSQIELSMSLYDHGIYPESKDTVFMEAVDRNAELEENGYYDTILTKWLDALSGSSPAHYRKPYIWVWDI